jgi:hypothetical protein
LTVGSDRLDYSGDVATSMANITTLKVLINSTLSTEDAAMMIMDIKTPLPQFEYMKMLLSHFPEEIVHKCNLNALAIDGWVYIEIRKVMYGLKQAGLLENQLLQTHLAPYGYNPARHTWTLASKNTFNLYHSRSRRFRSQVRGQAARGASQKHLFANL